MSKLMSLYRHANWDYVFCNILAIEKSISGVQASNTASTSAFTFFREPSVVELKKWPNERGKKQLVMVGGGSQGGEKAWQQFFLMPDKKLEKKNTNDDQAF